MSLLESIQHPSQLKKFSLEELEQLSQEIRKKIIKVTSQNGGHIGPNLGVVELTIALHKVFDSPTDPFVFDVSHQGYVHKLLTGRNGKEFDKIRKSDGLSGFLNRSESPFDSFGAGHAGTALSAALGMATARDILENDNHVVAIIGDASLTCGITMEALNNAKVASKRLIVVLNDNEWSISRNVGAISNYLNELITNPIYNRLHDDLESLLQKIPGGDSIIRFGSKAKKEAKDLIVPSSLFEKFGLRYIGPIDGHNIELLTQYLNFCKKAPDPVILHVITTKGKGYDIAIKEPEKFHGTSPFAIKTGESKAKSTNPNYQDIFGKSLTRFARKNPSIVGITAAMPSGTGLQHLAKALPRQFFDVGIAEEHAILFAAGLATQGLRPVCAIYSTFLQRAFDQIIHDVCLQNLPVVFCMDRAGLSPNDGPTHHGLFDIAYLRIAPNAIIMQPKDESEMVEMLWTCVHTDAPTFIRYPRGSGKGVPIKRKNRCLEIGKAEVLKEGDDLAIWALGPWIDDALALREKLKSEEGVEATVVNARFAKPLDHELLKEHARQFPFIVSMEDHILAGGFGSAVIEYLQDNGIHTPVERIGWPDQFIEHGSTIQDIRKANKLDFDSIYNRVSTRLRKSTTSTPFL